MDVFKSQIELAEYAWKKKEYHNVVSALEIGFSSNFYEEDRIFEIIEGIEKSFQLIQNFFSFPEIRKTDFSEDVISFLEKKINEFKNEGVNIDSMVSFVGDFMILVKSLLHAIQLLKKHKIIIGEQSEPHISVGIKENVEGKVIIQVYNKISEISAQDINPKKLERLKKDFDKFFIEKEDTARKNLLTIASSLLNLGEHWTSIEAFEQIAEMYPEEEGNCENMIGANYFYLKKYKKAIERYLNALYLGENKEMIEYNIWESCTKLIEMNSNREELKKWKDVYYLHFPNGKMKFDEIKD